MGGLLEFLQIGLRFNGICLKFSPGIFVLRLGLPGLAVFLELPRFRNKAIGDADDLPFFDRLSRRCHIINTLIQPRLEAFKWLSVLKVSRSFLSF